VAKEKVMSINENEITKRNLLPGKSGLNAFIKVKLKVNNQYISCK